MATFRVTVERVERIAFEIEATDRIDAEERYLADGDETDSKTLRITVLTVERVAE